MATRSEEEALRAAAGDLGLPVQERLGAGETTYLDLGEPGVGRVLATRTSIGPFGHGGSASRAIYCMAETSAVAIVSVGMAFGVDPARQRLGDVLVSTALLPYDNRDVRSDIGLPVYRYHRAASSAARRRLVFEHTTFTSARCSQALHTSVPGSTATTCSLACMAWPIPSSEGRWREWVSWACRPPINPRGSSRKGSATSQMKTGTK